MRSLTLTAIFFQAAWAFAQLAPAFDAASVKLSDAPNGDSSGVNTKPGRMEARNVTLRRLIRGAYNLPEAQVFGGPPWVSEVRYNIDAKANGPAGDDDLMLMLQSLLAERFQLKIHRETRQLNGYALVIGKSGFKGERAPDAGECSGNANTGGAVSHITATSCPVSEVARKLAECLHQPVADATGIAGLFNFSLDWSPDDIRAKAADAAAAPSLDDVLNRKFGLKLEARKVPMAVIVIDSATPASAN
jgi:uncharacterized protein (TIGR03435 family)